MNKQKRILIVFHLNFLRNDRGCCSYLFNLVKYYKKQGFIIDFLSNLGLSQGFNDFDELNQKEQLIDNLYLFKPTKYKNKVSLFGIPIIKTKYKTSKQFINYYFLNIPILTRSYKKYYSPWVSDEFVEYYNKVVNSNHYDYINIHYIQFADLLKYGNTPKHITKIYSMQDANYVQEFYRNKKSNISNLIEQELNLVKLFDKIMAISYDEKHFFEKMIPGKEFYFLPHLIYQKELPEVKEKDINVLFLGYTNSHNENGIIWFIDNVYPHLKNKEKIWIVGKIWEGLEKNHPNLVKKLSELGIKRLDFAEDLEELYARTRVSIVPMLEGAGMKIKTIDSMSRGIPVVANYLGVDGFPDKNKNGCLVTNDPEEFAFYIDKLLDDKEFYARVQTETKEYFKNYLSVEKSSKILDECFEINKK